jgi:predicted nucleotidyltransferase
MIYYKIKNIYSVISEVIMRLTTNEISAIKNCISEFDPVAKIYLYGSRTRNNAKGGDIDLLILTDKIHLEEKIKLKLKLYDALGEQKIDILIPNEENKAFVELALKNGILL